MSKVSKINLPESISIPKEYKNFPQFYIRIYRIHQALLRALKEDLDSVGELAERVELLELQYSALVQSVADNTSEINNLKTRVSDLETQYSNLESRVTALENP